MDFKKLLTIWLFLFGFFFSFSQSLPINYQAVIRDNQGAILANEAVTLRFTLLQGSANGTALYIEDHQETTNQFGLINIQLGTGITLGGDFYQIDWSLLDYFLKLEIQNGNGQGFTDLGTSKFVAVPYANFALNAANVNNNDTSATNELQNLTINNNIINLDNNGGAIDLTPYLDNTDSQTLTRTGNQISISGGNNITLPADQVFDGDSSVFNELQAISFTNDTLTLSNGGKVYLGAYDNSQAILFNVQQLLSFNSKQKADSAMFINLIQLNGNAISNNTNQLLLLSQKVTSDSLLLQSQLNTHINLDNDLDSLNELQVLSISNDTVYISKGGFIVLPNDEVNDADNNPTNELQALSISNDTIYLSGGGFVVLPADLVNDNDADSTNEIQSLTLSGNSISLSNANTINLPFDNDTSSINEIQSISISNDTIYLNNGGFVVLPNDEVNDLDNNPNNELQVLSISNDTIHLTNGGFAVLPTDNVNDADADSLNELQLLSISNDTISLTNGNYIVLPADLVNDADADNTNEIQTLSISNDTVFLANGGFIVLPLDEVNDIDADTTNEVQSLSLDGNSLSISKSNSVLLPSDNDTSSLNELQILSISNDSLKLSNGGFVDLTNYDNMQAVLGLYNKLKTDSATFRNLINTNSNNIALNGSKLDTTNQVLENHLTNDLDIDTLNEIQALTISNDTLFLESGGFVDLTNFRDYNSLNNKPESLSDFANDAGFLTNQNTSSYQIGDTAFGGIIFYVNNQGTSGLVISQSDLTQNLRLEEAYDAASNPNLTNSYFTDWRLPTLSELGLVFDNLYKNSIGNISGYYWASTSHQNFNAQEFAIPSRCPTANACQTSLVNTSNNNVKVRAVRSFGSENIIIPENLDNDSTNEIQTLSISNDTISLSKSNYLKLPKDSFTVYKGTDGIKVSNDTISKDKINVRVSFYNDTLWVDGTWLIIPGISNSNQFGPPPPVTDIDGNIYNTVKIGNQVWMAEDLRTTKYKDGTLITEGTGNGVGTTTSGVYVISTHNFNKSIGYYNAISAQNTCPVGWHLPFKSEIDTLFNFINNNGGKLKSTSTNFWDSPNTGATNSTGFNAIGSGYFNFIAPNAQFLHFVKKQVAYWTSTPNGTATFSFQLSNSTSIASTTTFPNNYQCPIRCIKD